MAIRRGKIRMGDHFYVHRDKQRLIAIAAKDEYEYKGARFVDCQLNRKDDSNVGQLISSKYVERMQQWEIV